MIIEKDMWILPIHISIKGSLIKIPADMFDAHGGHCDDSKRYVVDAFWFYRFKLRSSTLLCGFFTGRLRWSRGSPIPGSIPV